MASPIQAGISSPRGFQGGFGPIRENSIAVDGLCWPETARPRVRHRPLDVVPTPLAEWRESDRCLSAAGAIIALPLRTPALGAFLAVPRPSGLLPRLQLLTPHHVLRVIDGSFHDGLIALGRLLFELPRRPRVRLAQRGPLPRLPRPDPAPEPETDPRPIPGWSPSKLEDGSWGARFKGDTRRFPDDLVGQVIEVTTQGGDAWTASVVEVIHWGNKSVQVRHSGKPE